VKERTPVALAGTTRYLLENPYTTKDWGREHAVRKNTEKS